MDISQYISSMLFITTLYLLNKMESMITGELTLPLILFFVCFFIVTKRYDEELKKEKFKNFYCTMQRQVSGDEDKSIKKMLTGRLPELSIIKENFLY